MPPPMYRGSDLPVELLVDIFSMAIQLDDPRALDHPHIEWQSKTTILSSRAMALRRETLATKSALAGVCRQWNAILTPSLYEHVAITSEQSLKCIVHSLDQTQPRGVKLSQFVVRLDVELVALTSPMAQPYLAYLFRACPSVTTLVMILGDCPGSVNLLHEISPRIKSLYWKTPADRCAVRLPEAPVAHFYKFLNAHPTLVTTSLSFSFSESGSRRQSRNAQPHYCVRDFVIQTTDYFLCGFLLDPFKFFPNLDSRQTTWDMQSPCLDMSSLLPSVRESPQSPGVKRISIVVPMNDTRWPSNILRERLGKIRSTCPKLRELHLTFVSETDGLFSEPLELIPQGLELQELKIVSFQRVSNESDTWDRVGTLYRMVELPWKDLFPSLRAIRINEDLDFECLKGSPLLEVVREDWTTLLEERGGCSKPKVEAIITFQRMRFRRLTPWSPLGAKKVAASLCVLSLEFAGFVYANADNRNRPSHHHSVGPSTTAIAHRQTQASQKRIYKLNPDSSGKLPENRMANLTPNDKAREEREARREKRRKKARWDNNGADGGGFGNGMDAIREQERELMSFRAGSR